MMMGLIKGLLYKQALDKCISSYAEYKLIRILLLIIKLGYLSES